MRMLFGQKAFYPLWLLLLSVGIASAELAPERLLTDGIYRSEVQTNAEGTDYISMLRFAPDGQVFLMQVAMPATQTRVCEWFKPELQREHWATGKSYSVEGSRLTFQTVSLNATTLFNGAIESGVLRLQLVVPTKQNLTYPLTFRFAACA
jgi:hypothetical protein